MNFKFLFIQLSILLFLNGNIFRVSAQQLSIDEPSTLLSKMIKYESVSGNEKPFGVFISNYCKEHEFKIITVR